MEHCQDLEEWEEWEEETKVIQIPYCPRPLQIQIHNELGRWNLLVCHRRFGKTVLAINELIKSAITCDLLNGRFAYVAPLYNQAKQIAWDYIKHYARSVIGARFNESELRCDLPNGSRIKLYGADNPDSLRGLYLDGVVLDEYKDMPARIFTEIIRPALSDRKGWAIFIGSAQGGTTFHDLYETVRSDPSWYVRVFRASETGVIDPSELEDARRVMSADEYSQEYECDWSASIKGAYYGHQMHLAEQENRICSVMHDESLSVNTYWDLGVGDSTAIWFSQQIGNEIRLIDYYEMDGEGLPHYAKVLQEKGYVYGEHWAPHDISVRELGSGMSRIETAKKLGISFRVVPKLPVDDGINAARMILGRCWINSEKCKEGIIALKNYRKQYDDRRKCFSSSPHHDWTSHAADAFRYMAVTMAEKSRAKKTARAPVIGVV